MAKEICQKYLERRAGALPEDCAVALASAACLCLRRRNASLAEVSLILGLSPARSSVLAQRVSLPRLHRFAFSGTRLRFGVDPFTEMLGSSSKIARANI